MRTYNKEYHKKYYQEHKQEILERNKQWQKDNKERFYKLVYKCRKKKANALKEQGITYAWLSEKKRKEIYEGRNERINRSIEEEEV